MGALAEPVAPKRPRGWNSLPRGWLPEFDLVALWIHDPTELSKLGIVCLLQDVESFVAQRLQESRQILNGVRTIGSTSSAPVFPLHAALIYRAPHSSTAQLYTSALSRSN